MEDQKNSMPEQPDLMEAIDKLRANPEKYLNFYKGMLEFEHPKMQSTSIKQGKVPEVKLN